MGVKITVNPNDPDKARHLVMEHDRQVVLDIEVEWTDGSYATTTIYFHGTTLKADGSICAKQISFESTEPISTRGGEDG